jgi:glyoxylase-like metal-dependent hydrolase (beta-lactamase superfamily II)
MRPAVTTFFHEPTFTATHLIADPATGRAAIVDSVLDFDAKSGRTATKAADALIAHIRAAGLGVDWILETHVHADHLTAAPYLKKALGGRTGIGAEVSAVQRTFAKLFNTEADFATDGRQFDAVFKDGERFALGALSVEVLHVPGHTPACVAYRIGDAVFVGDTLFMPDYGTARCDFPGGDAAQLYRSIRRLYALPGETRLFLCHDYKAPGRDRFVWETTVAAERAGNIHLKETTSEAEFVAFRRARDAKLDMPALLLPAVQVNMRAGHLPPPEANGVRYLKLPVDAL